MTDYTKDEFNLAMAKLDGKQVVETAMGWREYSPEIDHVLLPDYHGDLNLLMPLAWKHGVRLHDYAVYVKSNRHNIKSGFFQFEDKEKRAIRDCLWKIAKAKGLI